MLHLHIMVVTKSVTQTMQNCCFLVRNQELQSVEHLDDQQEKHCALCLYRVGHKDPPSTFYIDPLSSLRETIYLHFYFEFQLTLFRALK